MNHLSATVLYTEMVKIVTYVTAFFFFFTTFIKISKVRVSESLQMTPFAVGGPLGVPVLHGTGASG